MSYIWILPPPRQRGFLLITGLLITSSLILLTTGSLVRSQVEWTAASRFLAQQQALYLAEGRMEQVVAAFALDPTLARGTTCPSGVDAAVGTTSCTLTPLQLYVNGPGGLTTQPVQILVTATVPNALTPLGRQSLEAVVEVPSAPLFQWAGYSDYGIAGLGWDIVIDSYNSSLGPYTPPAGPAVGATIQDGDGYGSCGGGILLNRRGQLFGDAFVAPGCNPSLYIITMGGARIYGVRGNAPVPILPVVKVPVGTPQGTPLTSCPGGFLSVDVTSFPYSAITLSEPCNLTLTGNGTLALNDFYFDPTGGSQLTVNGSVQLTTGRFWLAAPTVLGANASVAVYANGEVLTRGEVNGTGSLGRPKDFALYALGTGLANEPMIYGKLYGTVYASSNGVTLPAEFVGSYEVFGSVIAGGGPVFIGRNAKIHQDLSLKTLGAPIGPSNPIKLRSWRTL